MSPRVAPFLALFFCCFVTSALARPPKPRTDDRPLTPPAAVQDFDFGQRIDANNISMVVTNTGSFAFDLATGSPGLEFPKGSGKTAMFAAGLWLGALVDGQPRLAVSEYSDEYGPGAIIGGAPDNPNNPNYRVFKLNRSYANTADRDAALADYNAAALPHGAPPVAVLPDGTLDILGDQMLWAVYNDADPANHFNNAGSTPPLGVEVQQTTFAFNRPGPLANTVFIRFKVVNRGPHLLHDTYFGFWFDPDLGGFTDDLVGCIPSRSLGYCYNATNSDFVYGSAPPAIGVSLLQGPELFPGGPRYALRSFSAYINGTDPNSAAATYYGLQGRDQNGNLPVDPTTGIGTEFMFPGDPLGPSGWLDGPAADKRMLLGAGPVEVAPGQEQELMIALVVGAGDTRLHSVQQYLCDEDAIRQFADGGFTGPTPGSNQCFTPEGPCDRPADYWSLQCGPGAEISPLQMQAIGQWIDEHSGFYEWTQNAAASLCAELGPGAPGDVTAPARREFASLMATVAASELGIQGGGAGFSIDLNREVQCPSVPAADLREAVQMAQIASQGDYLDLNPAHPVPIEGFDWGGQSFGGGVGRAFDLFGSSIFDAADFPEVEIRFDHSTPQYAYRFLRRELPGGALPSVGRGYVYGGFHQVPFTCWDVTHNVQLDVLFLEKVVTEDDGTILGNSFQYATFDSTWSPDDSFDGNRELLWVIARPYTGSPLQEIVDNGNPIDGVLPSTYVLWSRRLSPTEVIDDGDRFSFTFSILNSGVDAALMLLAQQSPDDPGVQQAYADIATCLHVFNENDGRGPGCPGPAPIANAGGDVTAECTGSGGTFVQLDGSASQGADLSFSWLAAGVPLDNANTAHPSGLFPVGTTQVTLLVSSGEQTATDNVEVTIYDTTPPTLSISFLPAVLWPPNHGLVSVHAQVVATDCDGAPEVVLHVIGSSENDAGTGPDDLPNDIQGAEQGTADFDFQLRAERAEDGPGRIYKVCYQAYDHAGNGSSQCADVFVPHDRKGRASLFGGPDAATSIVYGSRNMPVRRVDGASLAVSSADFQHVGSSGLAPAYGDRDGDGFEDAMFTLAGRLPPAVGPGPPTLFVRWLADGQGYMAEATPSAVTGIAELELPARFEASIAGNPVREAAIIGYALPRAGRVRIGIFDVAGHRVATLVDGWQPAGRHQARFEAPGSQLYFYRVEWEGLSASGKVVVVK